MMRKLGRILGVLVLVLGLAVMGLAQTKTLTILHTNDTHSATLPFTHQPYPSPFAWLWPDHRLGWVDEFRGPGGFDRDYAGIARMATIAHDIRATSNRSLWLDSGDCFQGAPEFNMFMGEAEMRALTTAALDAAVIANHEFDLGSTNLFEQIDDWAGFQLLAANYLFEDPPNPDARSLKDLDRGRAPGPAVRPRAPD